MCETLFPLSFPFYPFPFEYFCDVSLHLPPQLTPSQCCHSCCRFSVSDYPCSSGTCRKPWLWWLPSILHSIWWVKRRNSVLSSCWTGRVLKRMKNFHPQSRQSRVGKPLSLPLYELFFNKCFLLNNDQLLLNICEKGRLSLSIYMSYCVYPCLNSYPWK